ncbi:unnamed protein product, partial [Oppiella nova]
AQQLDPSDPHSPWVRTQETRHHVLASSGSLSEACKMMRRLYPLDSPCIGYRKVLEEQVCTDSEGNAVRLDGKVLRKFRLSPYVWMTYGEVYDKIDSISRGMVSNGFQRKDKIVILSETSADNLIFLQVCMNIGAVIVTVFATLGDEEIKVTIQ